MHKVLFISVFLFLGGALKAQFGYGYTVSNDLYHIYTNPKGALGDRSAGNAILNLGMGPKLWLGNKKFSFSVEAQAVIGFTTFSTSSYQGMGSLAFPMMAKFNFNGMSSFDREMGTGWSIGAGLQSSRTELYGVSKEDYDKGVRRSYFDTYVIQAAFGGGLNGFAASFFVRYGFNKDTDASTLNIGLQYDFNRKAMKKINTPESSL